MLQPGKDMLQSMTCDELTERLEVLEAFHDLLQQGKDVFDSLDNVNVDADLAELSEIQNEVNARMTSYDTLYRERLGI